MLHPFHAIFPSIIGQPCWAVHQGYGSFLTLEWGIPSLSIQEPTAKRNQRIITVRGQWHLWIYCCDWTVSVACGLEAKSENTHEQNDAAFSRLDGQLLTAVEIDAEAGTRFEFDQGGLIETRRWPMDDEQLDQWILYEPSGYVFSVRADRHYSHDLGTTPPDAERWRTLPPGRVSPWK